MASQGETKSEEQEHGSSSFSSLRYADDLDDQLLDEGQGQPQDYLPEEDSSFPLDYIDALAPAPNRFWSGSVIPDGQEDPVRFPSGTVVPDSQEDVDKLDSSGHDTEEDDLLQFETPVIPKEQSSKEESFKTIDTVRIPADRRFLSHDEGKYPLHKRGINVNGRLATEHPLFKGMDETATQPSTQPHFDQRRRGGSSMVSLEDESDVVCILHPTSLAAYRAVELIAQACPQHILQNEGLSRNLDYDQVSPFEGMETRPDAPDSENGEYRQEAGEVQVERQEDDEAPQEPGLHSGESSSKDIAIRFSSKVHDICLGWTFGRNPSKCDMPLVPPNEVMKISNSHFRIYLNEHGVAMVEDTSTNGTYVDKFPLKHKSNNPRRTIQSGSIIEILLSSKDVYMRFLVSMPSRDRARAKYSQNVHDYLSLVKQLEYRKAIAAQQAALAPGTLMPPPPVLPLAHMRRDSSVSSVAGPSLFAGNEPYTHGMRWNGGEKYNVVGHIGKGAFADVFKVATKENGELFAVKEMEKRRFMKAGVLDHKSHNEIEVMKSLNHPHIVEYVGYEELPNHLYIIMEFVPHGDLTPYVNSVIAMPEYMSRNVAHQIMSALDYLHISNVTHRDLKPDNILVASHDPFVFKLSDFGLSKVIKDEETLLKTFCGTLLYCAPEVYPGYENVKAGLPQKRRRRHDEPAIPRSPYQQSVDTWAFAAVLYHLMCGKPPYTVKDEGGGTVMLETVMSHEVDFGRLTAAGVSPKGVDFVSKMLVHEPSERATDAECLAHPWIADLSTEQADVDMPDSALDHEGHELDASQLSLEEHPPQRPAVDSDEEDDIDVDEITQTHRSKRLKQEYEPRPFGLQLEQSYDSIQSYDTVPMLYYPTGTKQQTGTSGGQRLFGEIGSSALRSSGVLDETALAALSMPTTQGSDDGSVHPSGNYTRLGNETNNFASDDQHPLLQPRAYYPPVVQAPGATGSAPSLLGAEAQIRDLNMTSPEMPSGDTNPGTPKSPSSREISPITASMPDTKRSSQEEEPGTESIAKRARSDTMLDAGAGAADDATTQHSSQASASEQQPGETFTRGDAGDVVEQQANEDVLAMGQDGQQTAPPRGSHEHDTAMSQPATTEQQPNDSNSFNGLYSASIPRADDDNTAAALTSSQTQTPNQSQRESQFLIPPLPSRRQLGKIVVIPGSTSGFVQKSKDSPRTIKDRRSEDYTEKFALILKTRWLFYGRSEEESIPSYKDPSGKSLLDYTHITHPDPQEVRVGKNCIEICFWRPGIEADEQTGKDWTRGDDFYAIIMTRSPYSPSVNGVKLRMGKGGTKTYGKLYSGDVITIFEETKEGKTEFMKFAVEFYRGKSREQRPDGEPFQVVEFRDRSARPRQVPATSSWIVAANQSTTTAGGASVGPGT